MTPSPLSPQQLDELDGLLAAATPGPWEAAFDEHRHICRLEVGGWPTVVVGEAHNREAELIAALINAAPSLLATVRRQQAVIDAVTELADEWDQDAAGYRAAYLGAHSRDVISMSMYQKGSTMAAAAAFDLRTALASPAPTEATT